MSQSIRIPRLDDKKLIEAFKKASDLFPSDRVTFRLDFLGGITKTLDQMSFDGLGYDVLNGSTYFLNTLYFELKSFNVVFYRGGSDKSSPYTDELVFQKSNSSSREPISDEQRIRLVECLMRELLPIDVGRIVGGGQSKELEELASIHEATLSRLEKLGEQVVRDNLLYRQQLDEESHLKVNNLEKSYLDKQQQLQESYQQKLDDLLQKEAEFEQAKKELDDKSNTHARRQLRKDIINEIKSRQTQFKLTDGTNSLRRPIQIAMLTMIGVFIVLAATSIFSFYQVVASPDVGGEVIWIAVVKQLIYSFGLIGSILFYIKWQNRWFEQHSLAEFHLKQLELDMERASWIVETSLEWNDVKGTVMPTELLESLSRNLFHHSTEQVEPVVHPADQLASALLGSAASIRLKAGDSELVLDPKKLRQTKSEEPSGN